MDDATQPPAILASDGEREQAVVLLRDALVDGRLTLEEFSERVAAAQIARTDLELASVTADLPARASHSPEVAPVAHRAVFSALRRTGAWELPARSSWRSICGTIELDLRQARLAAPDAELSISNVFGTATLLIPPGIAVEVSGGGMFASQVIDPPAWPPPPGAPRLRIHVSGPGGTLHVRSHPPGESREVQRRSTDV